MNARTVVYILLFTFAFATVQAKFSVSLKHALAERAGQVCKVPCKNLRNQIKERLDALIDDVLSKNFHCTDTCSSSTCKNGGVCHDLPNGYNCTCKPGYEGTHCEKDINECASSPCKNGGVCHDLPNGYNCTCKPGYEGTRCEKAIPTTTPPPKPTSAFEGSVILSRNKTYEPKVKEFLKPVVGDDRNWKLCFRTSIHGWSGQTFHAKCDGKRDTVTIGRKGENVFGGYVDTPWDRRTTYQYSTKAFIFSIRNNEGLPPFVSHMRGTWVRQHAIASWPYNGPEWGGSYDLDFMKQGRGARYCRAELGSYYSAPSGVRDKRTVLAGSSPFYADEIEVFYVV